MIEQLRHSLISYTDELADPMIDERWSDSATSGNPAHNIEFIINFYYDDTSLTDGASAYIGMMLKNADEAEATDRLMASLNVLFDTYRFELSDRDYVRKPEWKQIQEDASQLLCLLKQP